MAMTVNDSGEALRKAAAERAEERLKAARAAAREAARRSKKSKKPKKKLNYNPREISSQIVRAKKAQAASVVLVRAKGKVRSLQLALASGNYDMNEMRTAIAHANKMVNCARLKVRNLKEEELEKRQGDREHGTKEQQKKNEVKRRVRQKEQEIQLKLAVEENQQRRKEKTDKIARQAKKRRHRTEELGEITKADLEYIQDRSRNYQQRDTSGQSSVILEISQTAAQLSELNMTRQQLEQQVELELEMEGLDAAAAATITIAFGETPALAEGAEATAVDVSV